MASINSIRDKDAYWYWILIVFIGITTVCGNTLVIYLIFTRRTLHITANWFTLSLSFADLLVGLVVIPTYIIHTFFVQLNLRALLTFYNLILYVSVGNLCVMTGDRYLAITRPLKYASEMTRSKVLIMILIAWMIPTGLSLLSLLWQTSTESKDTVHRIYIRGLDSLDSGLLRNNPVFYDAISVLSFVFDYSRSQSKNRCTGKCQAMLQ